MIKNTMIQGFKALHAHIFAVMLILSTSVVVMYSCQKEITDLTSESEAKEYYDSFGPKLEQAISFLTENQVFKSVLIDLALEMSEGDTEVLLSSFLRHETKGGIRIKNILVENSTRLFTEEELDMFLDSYPSVILGLRGSLISWLQGTHIPPVVFVNSKFKESARHIQGMQSGAPIRVGLEKEFENAVIAINFSERHDKFGNPIDQKNTQIESSKGKDPSVDFSKNFTCSAQPEPTSCPELLPYVSGITGQPLNGGIRLTFFLNNFPIDFCYWGRIKIIRSHGPNTETVVYFGLVPSLTYMSSVTAQGMFWENSSNFSPNITYTYRVEPSVEFIHPTTGSLIKCANLDLTLNSTVTVVAPAWQPAVTTYRGLNGTGNTLNYFWNAPSPTTPIETYRIRLYDGPNVSTLFEGGPTNNYFSYVYPPQMRGEKVTTAIDHKTAASPWQPSFFDQSYASWRVSGEPLFFYGLKLDPIGAYEIPGPENPINGFPEIRLTAVRAQAGATGTTPQTTIVNDLIIPMTGCAEYITVILSNGKELLMPWGRPKYFFPTNGPREIMHNWDSDLVGSSISLSLFETDATEIVITGGTQTTTRSITANFGLKATLTPTNTTGNTGGTGGELSAGVTTSWTSASVLTIDYPNEDIPLGQDVIYYHEHRTSVRDYALYGNISGVNGSSESLCPLLRDLLTGEGDAGLDD